MKQCAAETAVPVWFLDKAALLPFLPYLLMVSIVEWLAIIRFAGFYGSSNQSRKARWLSLTYHLADAEGPTLQRCGAWSLLFLGGPGKDQVADLFCPGSAYTVRSLPVLDGPFFYPSNSDDKDVFPCHFPSGVVTHMRKTRSN